MDTIRSHHFETMVEAITFLGICGGSIIAGVVGGAGFRPSTVWSGD